MRAVVVRRPTDYEMLLAAHATRGQAEFFLKTRGQVIEDVERDHAGVHRTLERVMGGIPARWRRASIERAELSRFLFEPDDVVIAVGQDGLVANVAKYLSGQLVVGINPLPERIDGVLVRHAAEKGAALLRAIDGGATLDVQTRTMVRARLEDGQELLALNEVYLGHRTHQSARYRIRVAKKEERQSSSGIICCTGTGASGWGSSIHRATGSRVTLPKPAEDAVCYFVREAWPSKATGTNITMGRLGREGEHGGALRDEQRRGDLRGWDRGRLPAVWLGAGGDGGDRGAEVEAGGISGKPGSRRERKDPHSAQGAGPSPCRRSAVETRLALGNPRPRRVFADWNEHEEV
jgi:NAD kinase